MNWAGESESAKRLRFRVVKPDRAAVWCRDSSRHKKPPATQPPGDSPTIAGLYAAVVGGSGSSMLVLR
jgi:hypothetical protein